MEEAADTGERTKRGEVARGRTSGGRPEKRNSSIQHCCNNVFAKTFLRYFLVPFFIFELLSREITPAQRDDDAAEKTLRSRSDVAGDDGLLQSAYPRMCERRRLNHKNYLPTYSSLFFLHFVNGHCLSLEEIFASTSASRQSLWLF